MSASAMPSSVLTGSMRRENLMVRVGVVKAHAMTSTTSSRVLTVTSVNLGRKTDEKTRQRNANRSSKAMTNPN